MPTLPLPGQTVYGTKYICGFGGKGANQVSILFLVQAVPSDFVTHVSQAIMASLMGSSVHMVAKLGDDDIGRSTLRNFEKRGVSTDFISIAPGCASGVAAITVTSNGQNSIVIAAGANHLLGDQDLELAKEAILNCKVLLCQNEVPPDTTLAAMKMAKGKGPLVVQYCYV